jgi:hypothetical protein
VEIRAKSKAELRAMLVEQYGEATTAAIWDQWTSPKLTEGTVEAVTEPQDHDHDIDVRGDVVPVSDAENSAQNGAVSASHSVEKPDTKPARGPIDDIERRARESYERSKPPKV